MTKQSGISTEQRAYNYKGSTEGASVKTAAHYSSGWILFLQDKAGEHKQPDLSRNLLNRIKDKPVSECRSPASAKTARVHMLAHVKTRRWDQQGGFSAWLQDKWPFAALCRLLSCFWPFFFFFISSSLPTEVKQAHTHTQRLWRPKASRAPAAEMS